MSPTTIRPIRRTAAAFLVTAAALVAVAPVAAAHPPEMNIPCALLLARAAEWPGTTQTPDGPIRLFSDAYNSYLSSQPVCARPWSTSGD